MQAGAYRVVRLLSRSGSGRVYLAEDVAGRQVALKELVFASVPTISALEAFEREAELLKQLRHPQIPRFDAAFREGSGAGLRLYLAQQFVAGETLMDRLGRQPPGEAEVVGWIRQLLEIVHALHGMSPPLVHRDIKPANLIVSPDGVLHLVDFGSARELRSGVTHRSTLVGTFGYMAPEQLGGTVDARSDLYAIGATMLHLLTRRAPDTLLGPDLKLAAGALDGVGEQLRPFLETLLRTDRTERFASAAEALRALSSAKARQRSRPYLLPRVAFVLAAVLCAGALWGTVQYVLPALHWSTTRGLNEYEQAMLRGHVLDRQGSPEEALLQFRRALKLRPDSEDAQREVQRLDGRGTAPQPSE